MQNSLVVINNFTIIYTEICNDFWFANLTQAQLNFSNCLMLYFFFNFLKIVIYQIILETPQFQVWF